jgi:hypothetical protein
MTEREDELASGERVLEEKEEELNRIDETLAEKKQPQDGSGDDSGSSLSENDSQLVAQGIPNNRGARATRRKPFPTRRCPGRNGQDHEGIPVQNRRLIPCALPRTAVSLALSVGDLRALSGLKRQPCTYDICILGQNTSVELQLSDRLLPKIVKETPQRGFIEFLQRCSVVKELPPTSCTDGDCVHCAT